jgi:hypothetical protein
MDPGRAQGQPPLTAPLRHPPAGTTPPAAQSSGRTDTGMTTTTSAALDDGPTEVRIRQANATESRETPLT